MLTYQALRRPEGGKSRLKNVDLFPTGSGIMQLFVPRGKRGLQAITTLCYNMLRRIFQYADLGKRRDKMRGKSIPSYGNLARHAHHGPALHWWESRGMHGQVCKQDMNTLEE